MDGLHPPSDKDAILGAPTDDGGYVLSTVNQYPSNAIDEDWRGAIIEETSAFRADVEQFGDFHTLLWDADREQTLDARNDATDSRVSYDSPRVPEVHVGNDFVFDDGTEATLEQDVLVAADDPALLLRNRATFDAEGERTLFSVVNSSIHAGDEPDDGDEAYLTTAAGEAGEYDCLVSHDGERYFAVSLRRAESGQRQFDGQRIGILGETGGDDKSAWHDIYGEDDGYIDANEENAGQLDIGFGLHVGEATDATWLTAVGFGHSESDALDAVTSVLDAGYESERDAFVDEWEAWHEGVADAPTDDETANAMYERSLTSMKCAQDPRGAMIAGAFEPDEEGYRYVWPRDQVFLVAALVAAEADEEAREALDWLAEKQITEETTDDRDIPREGTWWQNYRTDGEPHWTALQLDQVAGPVYAHWLVWTETGDDDVLDDYYETSRAAAEFLLEYDNGNGFPGKSQDPWEEVWGYSTEGSAACIAGLRAMAEMAEARGDDEFAEDCRERAGVWADNFDDYCFVEDGYLGDHYVTADSPNREDDVNPDYRPDAAAFMATWPWNVVAADSDEMRSTVELAADPAWCADGVRCVGRYPEDDFTPSGEVEDGGWPLCEAFADVVRWLDGDEDAIADYLFEDAPAWTTAAGLLSEQVTGDGDVRWNANLQWSQAMYVLLAETHARGEAFGMAPS